MAPSPSVPTVAIIGGGFSGAAVAYHLAKRATRAVRIIVFEPRLDIGSGLAYSTTDPSHRINVPASRMTLLPDDESHFMRWLGENGEARGDCCATLADGRCFPARQLFGRYVKENLEPLLESGQVSHHRTRVESLTPKNEGWSVLTTQGYEISADIVVIATSHPPPVPPEILTDSLAGRPGFIADPWAPSALEGIASDARVLIVGTGLTMADVVASLDRHGHHGEITAISRRGQRSQNHASVPVEPYGEFLNPPARTAMDLLRHVRGSLAGGMPWQGLFDTLRTQGQGIWNALPLPEKRRLVRHLRPFWDTHRFRIAPQIGALLDRRIQHGSLRILAASLREASVEGGSFRISLRRRSGAAEVGSFDAVITTTGPGHSGILAGQSFLKGLFEKGLIERDPTGLGLAVNESSRLIGRHGPNATIFVAGPLARGRFGELMGLPEVTNHAALVADHVLEATHVLQDAETPV